MFCLNAARKGLTVTQQSHLHSVFGVDCSHKTTLRLIDGRRITISLFNHHHFPFIVYPQETISKIYSANIAESLSKIRVTVDPSLAYGCRNDVRTYLPLLNQENLDTHYSLDALREIFYHFTVAVIVQSASERQKHEYEIKKLASRLENLITTKCKKSGRSNAENYSLLKRDIKCIIKNHTCYTPAEIQKTLTAYNRAYHDFMMEIEDPYVEEIVAQMKENQEDLISLKAILDAKNSEGARQESSRE